MRFLIGSAALAAMLLAGPALADTAKPKSDRSECFRPDDVNGFTVVDDRTVDVTITPKKVYRLTLFSPSPDIDWSLRIGIDARGQPWICPGMGADIVVPGALVGLRRYPISDIRRLTPEEIKPPKKK